MKDIFDVSQGMPNPSWQAYDLNIPQQKRRQSVFPQSALINLKLINLKLIN